MFYTQNQKEGLSHTLLMCTRRHEISHNTHSIFRRNKVTCSVLLHIKGTLTLTLVSTDTYVSFPRQLRCNWGRAPKMLSIMYSLGSKYGEGKEMVCVKIKVANLEADFKSL